PPLLPPPWHEQVWKPKPLMHSCFRGTELESPCCTCLSCLPCTWLSSGFFETCRVPDNEWKIPCQVVSISLLPESANLCIDRNSPTSTAVSVHLIFDARDICGQ